MGWFGNLKTQSKLLIMFALIAFVGALATVWSISTLLGLQEKVHLVEQEAATIAGTNTARASILNQEIATMGYVLTGNSFWTGQRKHFSRQVDQYIQRAVINADTPDEVEDLNLVNRYREEFDNLLLDSEAAYDSQDIEGATDLLLSDADDKAIDIQDQLSTMAFKRQLALQDLVLEIDRHVNQTVIFSAIGLVALLALVVAASFVTNQISEPMMHLTNAVVAFENNAFEPNMLEKYVQRGDDMGQMARAFDNMRRSITETARAKDELLAAATRFVPGQYLDFLEKTSIADVRLGDHVSAEMAVMFSDIRGFTTMSESMSPKENFDFVNTYLKMVSPLIQKYEGFIVKFLGDGMMAIFPYGVDDAVKAGVEKQQQVKVFNEELKKKGLPPVAVGIGIHTGHMMVGMIGEERRMQGDAFSDNVNLTSRVEGLTKFYGVSMIITEETLLRLEQPVQIRMRFIGKAQVKGRERPISLYDVFEGDAPDICAKKMETKADFEQGIKLYTAGKFAEARQRFEDVLQRFPEDKTSKLYVTRCKEYQASGAPEGWEGVEVMESK